MSTDVLAGPRPRFVLLAWAVALAMGGIAALTTLSTVHSRYERDVARIVVNRNLEVLSRLLDQAEDRSFHARSELDRQRLALEAPVGPQERYIVVSVEEHLLTLRQGDQILLEGPIAVGKGVVRLDGKTRRFDTPRGRREVIAKEVDPVWVPPHWHYQEQAQRRGLTLKVLQRGQEIPLEGGDRVVVQGSNVGRLDSDGAFHPYRGGDEVVVGGMIIEPPFGTRQRRYEGDLGTRRLVLGDGYAIHGTDNEGSIGQSVSHGCIRMRKADIEALYDQVEVHTPVFIY